MTKFVTLTLCLLFAMTFNAIAQETSDAQSPEMQIPTESCQAKMQKKCDEMKDMTPEQKQAMIKDCPEMQKKCDEMKDMTPEQKQAMMKDCPEMQKKCDEMKDMTPEQKQAMMKDCPMMKKCDENKQ